MDDQSIWPNFPDLICQLTGSICTRAVIDDDIGTCCRQLPGNSSTYTTSRSSDNCSLTIKSFTHDLFLSIVFNVTSRLYIIFVADIILYFGMSRAFHKVLLHLARFLKVCKVFVRLQAHKNLTHL